MSGPYKVGEFGPHLIKDWGVSGPAGSEHSEHWSRKDAIQMAERLNRVHETALASLRLRVIALRPAPLDLRHVTDYEAGCMEAIDAVLALLGTGGKP